MEEEAFLQAISAAPDDRNARLIYADWLEERGDARAEFVRVQVQLREAAGDDARRAQLESRERTLRRDAPAYWLARLDPPVWCVVGAMTERGSRLFRPNAKVFLSSMRNRYALLNPGAGDERIILVGQHRQSRTWIECWMRVAWTTRWRVQLVHHPGVLVRLRESGWGGFGLEPQGFQWPADRMSAEALGALFEAIDATSRRR